MFVLVHRHFGLQICDFETIAYRQRKNLCSESWKSYGSMISVSVLNHALATKPDLKLGHGDGLVIGVPYTRSASPR
jgi:hypothetical protein